MRVQTVNGKAQPRFYELLKAFERRTDTAFKRRFYESVRKQIQHYPQIKALVYFNNLHKCDWRITSSSASVAAYRDVGRDPFLNRLH